MDPVMLNNELVLARSMVKKTKAFVIQQLCRKLRKINQRKSIASENKWKRKADLLIEEIQTIKQLKPDTIFKFAVTNDVLFTDIVKQPKYCMEERALARLAEYSVLKKKVLDFKKKYSNWKSVVDKCWSEKKTKKLRSVKNKKAKLKNSPLNKIVDIKKKKPGDKKESESNENNNSKQIINKKEIKSMDENIDINVQVTKNDERKQDKNIETHIDLEKVDKNDHYKEKNYKNNQNVKNDGNVTKKCFLKDKHKTLTSKKTLLKNINKTKSTLKPDKCHSLVGKEMALLKINVSNLTDDSFLIEDTVPKTSDSECDQEIPKTSFFLSMDENQQANPKTEKPKKAPLFVDEKGRPLNRKERRAKMRGEKISTLKKKQINKSDLFKPKSVNFIKINSAVKKLAPKPEAESMLKVSLTTEILHPSWEAKRLQKQQTASLNIFKGKKIHFDS